MTSPLIVQAGDAGFLVIDSLVGGRSCGGLRMAPGVEPDEVALLARAMTLKFGFLGLPQGGAKGGVSFDPDAPVSARRERLAAFATAIAPLLKAGLWAPMSDMGTSIEDIDWMLRTAGIPQPRRRQWTPLSGYYTARGVLAAARAAAAHLHIDLRGSRVVIEGFGKVGGALAGMLDSAGARVAAVSTSHGALYHPDGLPVARLLESSESDGSRFVETFIGVERLPNAQLLELSCDILFPCARHYSIHRENAARIAARAIVPGANSPCTPEAEEQLSRRGVLVVPSFASNAGGSLGGTMAFAGISGAAIDAFIEDRFSARIGRLIAEAVRRGVPLRDLALAEAQAGIDGVRRGAEHPGFSQRLLGAGLSLYRRGLIPEAITGAISPRYFDRLLAGHAVGR